MRALTPSLALKFAMPLAYQPAQAAIRLGVGVSTLYALIDAKEIKAFKIGTRTMVPETELVRFIEARLKALA